ncbi:PIG-L deacetylase family protein [Burkholderia gladioli]|uniref:PIG-L deacetylase family protein n=1 Tax=Burkholderia gladioli TaxID=28095 RepID=UPI001641F5D7|nr:PIG-L deacetylase family protein [Burkholderia gladioli]
MNGFSRVCVVAAHPDDVEIAAFGTLARLIDGGAYCHVIVATDGRRGYSVDEGNKDKLNVIRGAHRKAEAVDAMETLGIGATFLDFDDGFLKVDQYLISKIEIAIKELSPTLIITHSASCATDHQDHLAVGQATLNAASRAISVNAVWEMEPLKSDKAGWRPNLFVDITEEFDRKMGALLKHQTQIGREYLNRPWQEHRARQNSLLAGVDCFSRNKLYESFFISRQTY